MNKQIMALGLAVSIAMTALPTFGGFTIAQAAGNCNTQTTTACDELQDRQGMPSFNGDLAPTSKPMVCFFPLHREEPTALVFRKGKGIRGEEIGTGFRLQPEAWTKGPLNRWYREVCLSVDFMQANRSGFTICGTKGHVYFSTATIDHILKKGRIGVQEDPACMFSGTCSFN